MKRKSNRQSFCLCCADWDGMTMTQATSGPNEYPVPSGSVDYALFNHGKPLVFIEAKRLGGIGLKGEDQLFKYASHRGVPRLILTDGGRWDFCLSMAAGYPHERIFYSLELSRKESIAEHMDFLESHLGRATVISGAARQSAERWLACSQNREVAQQAIPVAWRALLSEPNEMLCELIAKEVEREIGIRPDSGDIGAFLSLLPQQPKSVSVVVSPQPPAKGKIVGFVFNGVRHETGNAINTLASIVTRFSEEDSELMERFANKLSARRGDLFRETKLSSTLSAT